MVYAFNGINDRAPLWGHLRRIAGTIDGPWAIAGDFNCVLAANKRVGGNVPSSEMEPFRDCVADCGVLDIAATGALYTWNNKQQPEERIYSRLDRVLVNKDWCDHLQDLYAHFLPEGMYDHTPCIVSTNKQVQGKRSFKYFNMWGGSKDFIPMVRSTWQSKVVGTPMFKLVKKLKILKPALRQLNREKFSDIEQAADIKQKQIEELQDQLDRDPSDIQKRATELEAAAQLKELAAKKRYQAIGRIHKRIIEQGPKCSSEDCAALIKPVSGKEVKDALFSIPDIKSPGPDGYTSKFFKDAWVEVRGEVIGAIQDFFLQKRLLTQINATTLTLIPKCERPQNVTQFRPITCCNVVYKVISKLLCNRLVTVLPHIVDQNQGAFIQNRSIQENILICQDLIRLYERPNASARCLFKIDLQKAYDTVEWQFVEDLLRLLKFPADFQSITLKYAATKYDFHFHPMCKNQRLACLMFADDVLLFSKGDTNSMMLLLQSFSTFSKASGLKISPDKSNAYFRGVPDHIKIDIFRISGFTEGVPPFKYLGMPIQTTRLKKSDCASVIEKIRGRGIIRSIEATCRNFLWDNGTEYRRVPLVAWEKVCTPKEEGRLGLKNQEVWNKAMVVRLVNWISEKRDSIWVQWVQCNHIRGRDWFEYTPSTNSSWVWRRICKVKQEIAHGFVDGGMGGTTNWVVWNNWALPKHQFMGWLVAHEALNTVDKIVSYGMDVDASCLLCGQANESLSHLFFACQYSRRVLLSLQQNTGCSFPPVNDLAWWYSRGGTNVKRGVQIIVLQIIDGVRNKIRGREKEIVNANDVNWLCHKNLM
ncbi:uncharacterized protein LOC141639300 [Silene latifolia]|uniref:uncharacterized protein LOC141639300 n=1 Tax=Silene latifolia TaxID=37657 RepID=UPI003D7707BB